jgi:DNA polymerase I-like protein with 3'-5' exonuclease and polymerase domains
MNVTTRAQFEMMLTHLKAAKIVVFDTETNGLYPYQGNRLISLSLYFPEVDASYNLAFRNGTGTVQVDDETPFEQLSWQKKAKKQQYLRYWYTHFSNSQKTEYWQNLPIAWLDEIKATWALPGQVYIGHNVKFDLHVLRVEGFPLPEKVEDTMIALHTLFSDWSKIKLNGEYANRRLKWQAQYWKLPGAFDGEENLEWHIRNFETSLIHHIIDYHDDPMNKGVIPAKQRKGESYNDYLDRCYDAILGKISVGTKGKGIDRKAQMWMMPAGGVAKYAELDVVLTWGLREKVNGALSKWDNQKLLDEMQAIQLEVAFAMEAQGFKIDRAQAEAEIAKLTPEIEAIEQEFKEATVQPDFKVTSWQSTLPFLRANVDMNISGTGTKILRDYSDNPWVKKLLRHRMLSKTVNTYLKRWLAAADETDTVRSSFNADGTATGRFSSSGDGGNLQNIPDRRGYTIKRAIITPNEDWMFLAIDYSTLELRLATWIAEVQLGFGSQMYDLFVQNKDMHAYTRDMADVRTVVFGDMTDEEVLLSLGYTLEKNPVEFENAADEAAKYCRFIAKTMNFGLLYGGGKRMLSKLLNIDLEAAQVLVDRWNGLFPAYRRANRYYQDLATEKRPSPGGVGAYQYVTQPISGRHRKYDQYTTSMYIKDGTQWLNINQREQQQRKAWNNIVQGLGGYLCARSALTIQREFDTRKLRMFAQIHDALDNYIHRDHLAIIPSICDIMCDWDISPELKVEWSVGQNNWQDLITLKKYEKEGVTYKPVSFDKFVSSRGYHTHDPV